jgi:heterodisulfide reductase subunit A
MNEHDKEEQGKVKLIFDGQEVEVDKGLTLIQVAKELGVEIPTLCHHQAISPYGACRVCLVEVITRGKRKLVASCSYPVEEGIEVKSGSERVMKIRRLVAELLLARAPGVKKIQELAESLGIKKIRFRKKDDDCILCGLCVRFCEEIIGTGAIGFINRGIEREITTPLDERSEVCIGCGACAFVCPTGAIHAEDICLDNIKSIPSEFNMGLGGRSVIHVPFPQAVPCVPVIDRENCIRFNRDKCGVCEKLCSAKAVDYQQEDEIVSEKVGTIVVATGYDLIDPSAYLEYGYGKYPDVITGLEFERLVSASGPTGGELKRRSDGKIPKNIVFIQCVGSRDESQDRPYCSGICCMYTAKQVMLFKHKYPQGKAFVFYIDVRAVGKNYEEFVRRAVKEDKAMYLRGRVSKIFEEEGKLVVRGADTLSGAQVEIKADMVVLATAVVATRGIEKLAQKLRIPYDHYNFLSEAHPKLKPVETNTAGIFLAGACQSPKDIPTSVAQASAAASKVQALLSSDELTREPTIGVVNETTCSGCFDCERVCAYGAVERKDIRDRQGNLLKIVAYINEGMCQGCGACSATCRSNSLELQGFSDEQLYAEINAL